MSIAACSGFINLDEAHLDKPVYRVLPFDRLLQSLVARELVLSKPKLWDDPFENALLKGAFRTQDGSRYSFVAQNYVYGQCWTLHRETDAMWRIYSAAAKGVRVSSTPRKLLRALQDHDPQFATSHCFIGRVTYQTKAEILRSLGNLRVLADAGPAIAESLLFKRNEFRHEREVRLIYYNSRHVGHEADVLRVPIDPNALWDKVVFDPRADEEVVHAQMRAARALGYTGGMTQSTLYRIPTDLVHRKPVRN